MPAMLHQVSFQGASLLPRDRYVNTFHTVGTAVPDATEQAAIYNALINFYNGTTSGAGTAVANWMGPTISRTANSAQIKSYWLPDALPRSPRATAVWTPAAPGNTIQDLPTEVAVCVSYFGTTNVKRRRGRIYIGPLIDDAMTGGAAVRVASALRTNFAAAAARLVTELAATGHSWCVHSEAALFDFPVTGGWVDNEFDTVRRRGLRSDARTVW